MKGPKDKGDQYPNAEECNIRLKEDEELEDLLESIGRWSEEEEWEADDGWEESRDQKRAQKWMAAEEQAAYGLHAYPELETAPGADCPCTGEVEKPWEREGYRGPRLKSYPEEEFDRYQGGEEESGFEYEEKGKEERGDASEELQNEKRYVDSVNDYGRYVDHKEAKYEYRQGYIYEMAGGSPDHAAIIANLMGEVRGRLRQKGRRCRAYSSDLMVHIEEDDCVFLPDVSVLCGPPELSRTVSKAITNPVFLAEVLSPSTEDRDRTLKFESYKLLPTFREYLVVSQEAYLVDRYWKNPHNDWIRTRYMSIDQEIKLKTLGITIPMDLIYEDVRGLTNYFVVPNR